MTKIRDKDLHRYVDGELSPAEMARIRRLAEQDQSLARRISGIEALRQVLGEHFAREAEAGSDMDLLPELRERMRDTSRPSWSERLGWFLSWHSRPLGWSAVGLVAVACLVALVLMLGRGPRPPAGRGDSQGRTPSVSNRLVVEDYEGPPPTVFEIPDGQGSTTVLWVQPPNGDQGGRDGGVPRSRSPGSI